MSSRADFEDGHSDTEGAAGSHTRMPTKQDGPKERRISNAEKFASSMPPKKPAAPKPQEAFEDGHSDTESGAFESKVKRSDAGTATGGSTTGGVQAEVSKLANKVVGTFTDEPAVKRMGATNQ